MQPTKSIKADKIKTIVITSLVWAAIVAAGFGIMKYGEYQYSKGMVQGFEKAAESIKTQLETVQK